MLLHLAILLKMSDARLQMPHNAIGGCADEVRARIAAAHSSYGGLWADFLRNRRAKAEERARALLQILGAVPDAAKDADLWVTEADFWYIAGAAGGNECGALEKALECYSRSLACPDGEGNRNARRMRAEALLRLCRYEEAFEAFRDLAGLRDETSFKELEAAPFRLRHDAALCERLARLGRLDVQVASTAAAALRAVAARVERSPLPGGRQRWPRVAQLEPKDQAELRQGLFGELARTSAPYPEDRLGPWCWPPPAPGRSLGLGLPDALGIGVDWTRAEHEYRTEKITVVDDFFLPEALEELWNYSREATCFCTIRNGFLGAFPADGNVHPLILAAARSLERHMPRVLAGHPLGLWWLFKYTEAGPSGIGIHADAAAVNVNVWLTPDAARSSGGGLDIYTELPPVEVGVVEINREFATEEDEAAFRDSLLKAGSVRRVDYRRNRAAIFVSDLYHASQPFEFPDCDEGPRVNLTLLFGDRAMDRTGPPQQEPEAVTTTVEVLGVDTGAVAAGSGTAGKRTREESGWDLFD